MSQPDPKPGPATEQEVGIVEFVTAGSPISGILRHRWRDFQVHEIDSKGNVAVLTDIKPLEPVVKGDVQLTESVIEELVQEFCRIAGDACGQALKTFLQNVQAGKAEGKAPEPLVLPEEPDKVKRRDIHTFLKSNPKLPTLVTDSVAAPGSQDKDKKHCIRATLRSASVKQGIRDDRAKKRPREQGGRQDWGGGSENKYLKFVLYKENMDTQAAVGVLCRMLRVQNGTFSMAGTKDKRGVTSQFVTAFQLDSVRLSKLNPHLRGIRVGNFQYCKAQLRLGNLGGNQFKIIMRNVTAGSHEQVESACQQLMEKGFVNYFGLQRFGTGCVSTYKVGAALLKGEWQEAVELIMAGPEEEKPELAAARKKFLEKGDPQAALDVFPRFMVAERAVLEALRRTGATNYVTALITIPRTLRMMYLHAYQSYLWNHAVTHRLATYGKDRAVAGDLVLVRTKAKDDSSNAEVSAGEENGNVTMEPEVLEAELLGECEWETASDRLSAVHVVTEEEADNNKYSIYDVVLPIPGSEVVHPAHDTAKVYQEIASKDGVNLQKSPHRVHDFSLTKLSGDYRLILQKAGDVSWKLINYSDPNDDAITSTDWEQLQGCTAPCDACITSEPREVKRARYTLPREADCEPAKNREESRKEQVLGENVSMQEPTVPDSDMKAAVAVGIEAAAGEGSEAAAGEGSETVGGKDSEAAAGKGSEAAAAEAVSHIATVPGGDKSAQLRDDMGAAGRGDSSERGAAVCGIDGRETDMDVDKSKELISEDQQFAKDGGADNGAKDAIRGGAGVNGTGAMQDRKLLALELQFSLPSSSYATMVIRELTKECTSKGFHRALTAQSAHADAANASVGDTPAAPIHTVQVVDS